MYANHKPFPNALDLFRYVVYGNADWDPSHFDWDKDFTFAREKANILAVDADLGEFFSNGGKLLLYLGWNDYHNPKDLIEYYERLRSSAGSRAQDAVQLFLIPGMGHCFNGSGCDTFDKLGAIDTWVSKGAAPQQMTATRVVDGKVLRERPICAYPQVAKPVVSESGQDTDKYSCSN